MGIPAGILGRVRLRRPGVVFRLNKDMFVGSYQRVLVRTRTVALPFDDIDFDVPGGEGSTVSMSRDETFDAKRPSIMLLAGDVPGDYTLVATQRSTGTIIGEAKFTVTTEWADALASPTRWFGGAIELTGPQPTWGGGSTTGPQNVPATPQNGTRNVVIVLVDTADQRWSTAGTAIADAQQTWADNLVNGVIGADGVTRSVAEYYREVSYFNGADGIDISGSVLPNVVSLPNGWSSYFTLDVNSDWAAVGTFCRTVMTTAGVANFAGANMIVCVVQPVTTSPTKIAWPYGGYDATGTYTDAGGTSHTVAARGVVMSPTWGDGSSLDQGAGRTIYETLSHELGHTLNLPDAYKPVVTDRNVGSTVTGVSWDPMDWEDPWPHFTAAHRLMLGWLKPQWVKTYNFLALGSLVDEEVVLAPIEHGAPFPNAFNAIEVRVGDGHNYYFEYRRGEPGDIGDEALIPNARVVGIDVSAANSSRPDVLLLPKHTDDDGAVLDTGQKYHEIDATTPTFPVDFRAEVVSIDPDMARVRIRYEVVGKPDPTIRPWPRDAAHPWQSPDIEVSNAKSHADPQFANVPWNGHPNMVTARIANKGTLNAPGVRAQFFWKDYTVGGAPEALIDTDTHDIAPGATVNFSVMWTPVAPANPAHPQHYCIIVRIDPYSAPTMPPVPELTPLNNDAQSNYARFISASASPPSRVISEVSVANDYGVPTRFFLQAGQAHPNYRTYLEHQSLTLSPGEVRPVTVMFEYAPETVDKKDGPDDQKHPRVHPNHVSVVGLVEDPHDPFLHGPGVVTGVNAEVAYARATAFDEELKTDKRLVLGRVVTLDDHVGVPSGSVILVGTSDRGENFYETTKIQADGRFRGNVDDRSISVQAHFVPPLGLGECMSEVRRLG
jgi:CARDB